MQSSEPSKPFWERHLVAILAFIAAVFAVALALSDAASRLIVNQPPDTEIRITDPNTGTGPIALALATDGDGEVKDISYRWEVAGSGVIPKEVAGTNNSQVFLPTNRAGHFTVMVTVTDKGKKSRRRDAKFDITAEQAALAAGARPATPSTPAPVAQVPIAGAERMVLERPTTLKWAHSSVRDITTNGHALLIEADAIDKDLVIRAFAGPAAAGVQGASGQSGTNGGPQQAGSAGQPGREGAAGTPGKHAGVIRVTVNNPMVARLTIANHGQDGGDGGTGGSGGPGGAGGQGHSAQSGMFDCSSGPGYGGTGGDGGSGGAGGHGADGGNAGPVEVRLLAQADDTNLKVTAVGGAAGKPGMGGPGGAGGGGGQEGSASGLCRPAGRSGQSGRPGAMGPSGGPGKAGEDDNITAKLGERNLSGKGTVKLP
ncbi:collagen-like triple helix repeat-containing protein [Massilia aquatica]|uniref:Collagen-like protein n=1 Tax=Massilia aquatica TaxID=2609000 RepID=A0ABX0M632_9BURK|nr:collagen-like protein [Massilia aquatica]NHZ39049.1 collagen-like protein [Massilia aquatica]